MHDLTAGARRAWAAVFALVGDSIVAETFVNPSRSCKGAAAPKSASHFAFPSVLVGAEAGTPQRLAPNLLGGAIAL